MAAKVREPDRRPRQVAQRGRRPVGGADLEFRGAVPDPQPLVVSIGPVTSATAVERGLRVDAEADPHTIEGLIETLLSALPERLRRS